MLYALLLIIIAALCLKIYLLKCSARDIAKGFADKTCSDSNTLIDISSRDRDMRRLACVINDQLAALRRERLHFSRGNTELKNAVTNISHDLRTPLTAVCGYLDLLKTTDEPSETARYLDIIRERTAAMKQLTEELFSYSLILSEDTEAKIEEVFVNRLLAESITAFYPALTERGIDPVIELTDKRIVRNVDPSDLSRVFSNIISNAVRHGGGDLKITLSETGEAVFSNKTDDLTAVQVQRLFDRFYTVEAACGSTGLGLSIARTLTERMGGSIRAELEDGVLSIIVDL